MLVTLNQEFQINCMGYTNYLQYKYPLQSQMNKNQSVKVGIRIRPLNRRQLDLNSPICVDNVDNVLSIKKDKDIKQFIFDYVFGINSRQQSIYEACAFSIIENALQGYNGTIFAYGQTGAGKTYTMVGDYKDPQVKGIIPRTFQHVIQAIQTSEDKQYVVRASFVQIYNEDIVDLLEQRSKTSVPKKQLHQNPNKGVYIKDLKMIPVKSVDELFKILDLGNKNRTVHSTAMNAVSSRSHAIFAVHIESLEGKDKVKASKVNLVDLAGSQRQSKTQATGDRLKQGAKINLSLTALGNVINALVDGKKGGHIPYRDSKLTRLLQDSLGGNTKTLMIASVSPAADNYEQTVSTLRYAARARNIKNTPKINEDPKDAMIRQYLSQIQKLKQQLAWQGGYIPSQFNGISQEEHQKLVQKAKEEADQKTKELLKKEQEMRQMREKLKQMEQLVLKKQEVAPQVVKARKLKKKKIIKQEQLVQKRLEDLNEEQQKLLNEQKQNEQDKKVQGKSPQDKTQYWKDLAKKLRQKLRMIIKDKDDIQKQFEVDRQDYNKTIRNLQGQLSFYKQLAQKFINVEQIQILKDNSDYNQQKREYRLPPFLLRQDSVSLPKSLKINQVQDLWQQKRKTFKFEMLKGLQSQSQQKSSPISPNKTKCVQPKGAQSPFLQNRRIFKLPDYTNPIYQQKDYGMKGQQYVFRRTNFRVNDSASRSRSKSNKAKLQPLSYRPVSAQGEQEQKPREISRQKIRLKPIEKP